MVLATAGVWAGLAASFGAVWQLPADLLVGAGLGALTVVDLRYQLLPRRIVIPLGLGALALFGLAGAATDDGGAIVRAVLCAAPRSPCSPSCASSTRPRSAAGT